jgi:ubiquitin carboxyl-terminal hydrolase 4/11/15
MEITETHLIEIVDYFLPDYEQVPVNKIEDDTMSDGDDRNVQEAPILALPPSTTTPPHSPHRRHSVGASSHNVPTLREYGSGLANLGNTCFMSSTIQCLGHAPPLLKYFLSGSYLKDLNKDNPLGSGGKMALEFSKLLREIWIDNNAGSSHHLGYVSNNVVYPRPFKQTVGRHAEQFSGYDQHDSQEFVTYLLDILHEDTNRISKKPYIEKPEQGENETDEEAANKAWQLSLERDSSHILDFFMGQLKSRLQCCEENCGRVSTTFEPFVYLSVPIPGTEDRQIKTWFIPLDPEKRPIKMTLIVPKIGSIADLITKCRERLIGLGLDPTEITDEDLVAVDIFNEKVYAWHNPADAIDKIKDGDLTYIYQLRSLNEVRRLSTTPVQNQDESESDLNESELASTGRMHQLDPASLRRLNLGTAWQTDFIGYLRNQTAFLTIFNPRKGSTEARMKFVKEVKIFVSKCNETLEQGGYLKTDTDGGAEHTLGKIRLTTDKHREEVSGLIELSNSSTVFQNVSSIFDVAVLEFCAGKLQKEILNIIRQNKKEQFPDGAIIEVRSRYQKNRTPRDYMPGAPLLIRIPSNMTVYELREELANRMRRSIRTGRDASSTKAGEATSEITDTSPGGASLYSSDHSGMDNTFGSPELLILRQIPILGCKSGQDYNGSRTKEIPLGVLEKKPAWDQTDWEKNSSKLAKPSHDKEKEEVANLIGEHGYIYLDWPDDLADEAFDVLEYNAVEEASDDADFLAAHKPKGTTTVIDCIDKYCQTEQLEETEMWYCNRCKKHVRAWKQFYLYRAPPILIIHLKRFQFSAITHRRDKIGHYIDFPLEGLDLTKHFLSWKEEEKPIYDCFGVSNHFGGLGGGHYTAHALHNNGVWCYYDDTRITTNVEPKDVVTEAAYVLYYRRRDVSVDMDFPIAAETQEFRASPPADILENTIRINGHNDDASDSNAAMVGDDEDNMDVDDVETASHSTVPMLESVGWEDQPSSARPLFGDDATEDDVVDAPRQ